MSPPQRRSIDSFNCSAVSAAGVSYAASPSPSTSLMNGDATPRRNHLYDLPHLDKEIDYGWYAEVLVKALNLLIDDFDPEDTTGANGSRLLEYHIILSQVFTCAVSIPRMQKYPEAHYFILDQFSNIWTQSGWKANLINSFCNCRFRKTLLDVLVFFENELELCLKGNSSEIDQESSISYATLTKLLQLILPALLMLLQYVQALWTKAVTSNIPDVLKGAKSMVLFEDPGKTLQVLNIDEEEQEENAIRDWLETTRQSGEAVKGHREQIIDFLYLSLNIVLQSLMCELEAKYFFNIADDSMDWRRNASVVACLFFHDKKCFLELVGKFEKQVFNGLHLPDYDVIRGIMDYRAMSLMKNASCSWDHVFEKVVSEQYHRWIRNIPLFWMNTRYYDHEYYDIIQQPLQKIWANERVATGA